MNNRGNINGPNGQSGSLLWIDIDSDHTVSELDAGAVVEVSSAGAVVITLPANAPTAGFYCHVDRVGAGTVQFVAGVGASIQSTAGNTPSIADQYGGATITKARGNVWKVQGGIS